MQYADRRHSTQGLAIALYGIPSVYPSSFAIILDDTAIQHFISNSLISTLDVDNTSDIPVQQTDTQDQVSSNNSSQLIYFASNLSEGPHQLLIFDYGNGTNTNASASGLSSIRIDHAEVYSAMNRLIPLFVQYDYLFTDVCRGWLVRVVRRVQVDNLRNPGSYPRTYFYVARS